MLAETSTRSCEKFCPVHTRRPLAWNLQLPGEDWATLISNGLGVTPRSPAGTRPLDDVSRRSHGRTTIYEPSIHDGTLASFAHLSRGYRPLHHAYITLTS